MSHFYLGVLWCSYTYIKRQSSIRSLLGHMVTYIWSGIESHAGSLATIGAYVQGTVKRLQQACKLQEIHIPAHAMQVCKSFHFVSFPFLFFKFPFHLLFIGALEWSMPSLLLERRACIVLDFYPVLTHHHENTQACILSGAGWLLYIRTVNFVCKISCCRGCEGANCSLQRLTDLNVFLHMHQIRVSSTSCVDRSSHYHPFPLVFNATMDGFVCIRLVRGLSGGTGDVTVQMLEAAEGGLLEARRSAVAAAERSERLEAERDAALRQVAALQAALAGKSAASCRYTCQHCMCSGPSPNTMASCTCLWVSRQLSVHMPALHVARSLTLNNLVPIMSCLSAASFRNTASNHVSCPNSLVPIMTCCTCLWVSRQL